MIEIKNLLFQPLTLHREGTRGGLYLGPREKALLAEAEVSEEMRKAASRGLASLKLAESAPAIPAESGEENAAAKRRKEK